MYTVANIESLFVDDLELRKNVIRFFVMDSANSYEDRLHIYKNTPKHLQTNHGWIFHHPTIKDDDWMDYDCWNRFEKVDLTDIPDYKEWDDEKVKEWYTGCMDKGIWNFTFDW